MACMSPLPGTRRLSAAMQEVGVTMSEERKAVAAPVRDGDVSLARIVDSLGTSEFEAQLLAFLHQSSGADHCVAYRFGDGDLRVLGAASLNGTNLARTNAVRYAREGFWQRDPVVIEAERHPQIQSSKLVRVEPQQIPDRELREHFYVRPGMREKVFISGERGGYLYGGSIFRSEQVGRFSDGDLHALAQSADFLLSCFAKHAGIAPDRGSAAAEFASAERIERRLRAWPWSLSEREIQVCARILYGMSNEGIALDLGIKPESVMTYRKRAYQRIGIATRHELFCEFLRSI
jgi:DNA-binding CsgD family transcriptional regulator